MTADQFINILVTIMLVQMMMTIGMSVRFAEFIGVVKNWRLVLRAVLLACLVVGQAGGREEDRNLNCSANSSERQLESQPHEMRNGTSCQVVSSQRNRLHWPSLSFKLGDCQRTAPGAAGSKTRLGLLREGKNQAERVRARRHDRTSDSRI